MPSVPSPLPIASQVSPPSRLPQRPPRAIPAISRSSSGLDERNDMFPHSVGTSVRFDVTFTHSPVGTAPDPPLPPSPLVPPLPDEPPDPPMPPVSPPSAHGGQLETKVQPRASPPNKLAQMTSARFIAR